MLILLQAECAMFSRMKDDTALTAPVSLHLAVAVARSVPTGYQIARFNVFFKHSIIFALMAVLSFKIKNNLNKLV
jgi:hypothetical protein